MSASKQRRSASSRKSKKSRSKSPPHEVDTKVMRDFKHFFHGGQKTFFQIFPEAEGCTVEPATLHGTFSEVRSRLVEANRAGAAVCMAINVIDGAARKSKSVTHVNAVFVDLDDRAGIQNLEDARPYPHLVERTSPGHRHLYWLIKGLRPKKFKAFQRALAKKFGGDSAVSDLARVMRMPGTINHKRRRRPMQVTIIHHDLDAQPIHYRKLVRALGLDFGSDAALSTHKERPDLPPPSHDEIKSALRAIPAADKRDHWMPILMAVHSAMPTDAGLHLVDEWSQGSSNYDADELRRQWGSLDSRGGITVRTLFDVARKHGWRPTTKPESRLPSTDFSLIDYVADRVKGVLCHDVDRGQWLAFENPTWAVNAPAAEQTVRAAIEKLRREAEEIQDAACQKFLARHSTGAGVRSLLKDLSTHPRLTARTHDFDQYPELLAVANGVVDLKTGEFRTGRPEDRLTVVAPAEFQDDAACPRFRAFIEFVTQGDDEYGGYLQRAMGCTLVSQAKQQVLFAMLGPAGNGKGTYFRLTKSVLGDNVKALAPNLLSRAYSGNPQGPSPALMALQGPRMYQCSEGEDSNKFDTAFIKQLTGRDPLSGRRTYGDQSEIAPTGTLWLSCNSLPYVASEDKAMWRRMRVLPFMAKIERPDANFEDAFADELPGILNWMIEGALAYQRDGLGTCKAVERATRKARRATDTVRRWIKDRCRTTKSGVLQAKVAHDDYRSHCRLHGHPALGPGRFKSELKAKGISAKRTKHHNIYEGLELRTLE